MNRRVLIDSLPEGSLSTSNFALVEADPPAAGDGEVLCRTVALTIGAGQRAGLQGSASYAGAPVAGRVMGGRGIAVVEQSNDERFSPGDRVGAATGWQELSVHSGDDLEPVDSQLDPAVQLGVLGTNGLTAYFGLLEVGGLADLSQPEDDTQPTVVVSAAAGSVGHMVGQMAKVHGARVVGVAGSDEKCSLLTDELGFDSAINRKSSDFRDLFKAATQDRIDLYFDNTGGPILQSALFRMKTGGRIVCCGVVSQYDTASPSPGPKGVPGLLVNNRVRMEGFLVFDFLDRYDDARARMTEWIESGRLEPRVTEYQGLEKAGQAFVDLLAGATVGTTVVRVG